MVDGNHPHINHTSEQINLYFSGNTSIWIIGSSIIKRAWLHARIRPGGTNLGLERIGVNIFWQGYGGMKLWQVKRKVRTLLRFEDAPSYLMIHCGGNDIGEFSVLQTRKSAKTVINFLKNTLPNTKIIWSHVLPRQNWLHSQNAHAMERCRTRLNGHAASECLRSGGASVKYPDIKLTNDSLWNVDGVHLSNIGNDVLLNGIQGALEDIVVHGAKMYPTKKY